MRIVEDAIMFVGFFLTIVLVVSLLRLLLPKPKPRKGFEIDNTQFLQRLRKEEKKKK